VSIIVPVFNHEHFLNQILDSLISQSHSNLELILVNDGSTDQSLEVIENRRKDCEARFNRFTLINQENKGVSAALNLGVAVARNDFLFLIASDDVALPEAITKLFLRINSDESIVALFADSVFIDSLGDIIPIVFNKKIFSTFRKYISYLRQDINFDENLVNYLKLLKGNYLGIGILARKTILISVGGFDENSHMEDYDLWLKLSKKYKIEFYNEVLTHYRWHGNNSSTIRKKEIHFSEMLLLIRETADYIELDNFEGWRKRFTDLVFGYKEIRDSEIKGLQFRQSFEVKITNWGPTSCRSGEIPNMQPDGAMGIWVSVESVDGLRGGCYLTFNGIPALVTTIDNNLITAAISVSHITDPGSKEIKIVKEFDGWRSIYDVGVFTVFLDEEFSSSTPKN
jgi:alpha-1,3-rhamnosyltransferase